MRFRLQDHRAVWWVAVLLMASLPWFVSAALLSRHGMTWGDITPFTPIESDELFYWHQAASFRAVGFAAGYYTLDEHPAAASWTPYYAWGPFVPALYGTLAHIFGWQPHSMVIYNLAMLSLGVLTFAALARPPLFGLGLLGAIIATYSPLLIFHTVSMLPVMEMGLALGAAGLLYWHFQRLRTRTLVIATVVILLFALVRGTWTFVLIPLFTLTVWPSNGRKVGLFGGLALGLCVVIWGLILMTAAPYPDRLSSITRVMSEDLGAGLELWARTTWENILNLDAGYEAAILLRWVALGLIAALGVQVLWPRAKPHSEMPHYAYVRPYGVVIFVLLMLFALAIFAYDVNDWRDFRLLSPFVLMAVALVIAYRRWHWALLVLGVMIVGLPFSARGHNSYIRPKADPTVHAAYAQWQAQWAGVLAYDQSTPSRWCNTLLYPIKMMGRFTASADQVALLGAVPAGIGLSFYSKVLPAKVQSRWVIIDDEDTPIMPSTALQPVFELPSGALYRNLDSPCETTQPPEASPSG